MKLLQAVVAVLTVLLFLARQNVFCGVCPVKRLQMPPCYCSTRVSPTPSQLRCTMCARAYSDDDLAMPHPKYKKDPKISVDNEDIDCHPVE